MSEVQIDSQILKILNPPHANDQWRQDIDRLLNGELTLQRGSTGENAIKAFQRLMIFLGYSTTANGSFIIDGDFGRGTNRGLAQFLFEHNLSKGKINHSDLAYTCNHKNSHILIKSIPNVTATPSIFQTMLGVAKDAIDSNEVNCGSFEEAINQLNALHDNNYLSSKEINTKYGGLILETVNNIKHEKGITIQPEWILAIIKQETSGVVRPKFEQHKYSGYAEKDPQLAPNEMRFKSMSYGLGQIMGFNFEKAEAKSAYSLYTLPLNKQIQSIGNFLSSESKTHSILKKNQPTKENFKTISACYNGSNFSSNHYNEGLSRWFQEFRKLRNDAPIVSTDHKNELADFSNFITKYQNILKTHNLDPGFKHQWYLFEANIIEAWSKYGFGSNDITIAIIELQFDIKHPDFDGKIVNEKDFDFGSKFKLNDATEYTEVTENFQITSDSSHGTSVASLAIANKNGAGIIGVAPNVKFMPIRIGYHDDDLWIKAFEHAVENGANIISCSLGYGSPADQVPLSRKIKDKLKELSKKAVFCFAAGNSGIKSIGFSSHPDVIGVGACTIHNTLTTYSNTNSNTILTTPSDGDGLRVIASDITGIAGGADGDLDFNFGGTSASCPIMAGIISLMLSQNRNLGGQEIKEILFSTGTPLKNDNHHVKVNALKAIDEVISRIGQA